METGKSSISMQKLFRAFHNIYTCTYELLEYNRTQLVTHVLNHSYQNSKSGSDWPSELEANRQKRKEELRKTASLYGESDRVVCITALSISRESHGAG